MAVSRKNNGSVFLITIFIIALMSAAVIGMLQVNTEEIQLMRNQIYAVQALAVAEAGLNDAFSELRDDSSWADGFTDKLFNGGSYTVTVSGTLPNNLIITSTGTSSQGFVARVEAKVTLSSGSPYIIRIDRLGINE
jgi:Tfp pilus assembly protein PilX